MMDNPAANKSHAPCLSWEGQNGWCTTASQGPINLLTSSQHHSMGSPDQRPSYDHMQASGQSCMTNLSVLPPRHGLHHAAMHNKAPHMCSVSSSNALFANAAAAAAPSASHIASYAQQPLLITANHGKNLPPPSLPQPNQHLPVLSPLDHYKANFQTPLTSQGLPNGLQELPVSLPSCGQHEQLQWMPSLHYRDTVNESVPDAAVHSNKEPLPEGNITPGANNDRLRRSLLLHQRAQLLKQLEEMDKLLESIPPDEGSEGQAPQTNNQPQLVANSSPSLSREENETCEAPPGPVNKAISVKVETASAKSGDDSDPDYVPDDDDEEECDLSKSETEGCYSNESSHGSPLPPSAKPRPSRKKTAKPEGSLCKDENFTPPPKKIFMSSQKKRSETLVLPITHSQKHRVYDKRSYCFFCHKPVIKMARHLETVHSDKAEVAAAFQYPKHSKERQKIWNKLTNQGNFAHNKDVLRSGKGQLAVRKRPKRIGRAQDFLHCLYCQGLYLKKALFRHMRRCPEKVKSENESKIGRKRIASRCALEALGDLGVSDAFRSVMNEMIYDDVTQTIMDDKIILQFGEQMFNQFGSDEKNYGYIRQNLRQVARLVLKAQKTTPMQELEDFFYPSNFTHVVSAVNALAGYDPEKKKYATPSLALKLGYHLQKTCSIVEANAVKRGDAELAESARCFLTEYQENWNELISSGALTSLKETKLNADKKVPFGQDVKTLHFHLENFHVVAEKKLREETSAENYAALARVILCRVMMFNRRKCREVSSINVQAFLSRKKTDVHDDMDISVSDLEKTMCKFFCRIDIRGNCGRMVPVLLKPSFVSAMELLVKVREECGVPSTNHFLFARPCTMSAYRGSECIQRFVKACGAKNPEALTLRKIQKHFTTMLQLMNLDENEAYHILGPNNQVQVLRQNIAMTLDDVELQSGAQQQAASWHHSEVGGVGCGPGDLHHQPACGAPTSSSINTPAKTGPQGATYKPKQKWDEEEVCAVERHMMRFIQGHRVPQKNDCMQCLEAEPKALRTRTWKGVKDYVRNRITTLKRQTGSSLNASKTSAGQMEAQQQSTERYQQL
ncbi:uncharacterized protein LOC125012625 [Mugil cephalus]|uniref:uncharacterized protein LOC125012625 n=1 Tax=Mugil cephalus TaxID=48193 RepID=UPI001FB7A3E2|nr:uncharacterized protein LOC125012625 [Mugil cephalus]XP_047448632.1 uncharacterized protein LOC125012625 [Mugil cephalus]XP_047448633.1 uncharacterized protein LOC125012625 [Mugil cephalus]